MSKQQQDSAYGSILSGAALEPNRLIKLSSGTAVYCTATTTDRPIGVTVNRTTASGQVVQFKFLNAPGTIIISSASTLTAGAMVYPAASGQVSSTSTTSILGITIQAATAANDLVEVVPMYQFA